MNFLVSSRARVEHENLAIVPHIIISISTPGHRRSNPVRNEHTLGVIQLRFHDLDRMPEPSAAVHEVYGPIVLFDARHARAVIDLVNDHCLDMKAVIVHCDAGLSRSPALAAALAKKMNGDDDYFFRDYTPNRHVYRVMTEELQDVEW